jgi:hypothetical protein
MESPHDANALPLSPITRTIQAVNLTKFRVWVVCMTFVLVIVTLLFMVLLLSNSVSCDLGRGPLKLCVQSHVGFELLVDIALVSAPPQGTGQPPFLLKLSPSCFSGLRCVALARESGLT